MHCFVTGASGFLGANLVHALTTRGHAVRALVRPGVHAPGLQGVEVEHVEGTLDDSAVLRRAMSGCRWCFHAAASYQLWLADYAPMYATNIAGTRRVLEAAMDAGVERIVYTSTVGCIGVPRGANGSVTPSDESTPLLASELVNHYKLTKWKAEEVVREFIARGAPIVIVNPSAPAGPHDAKPTPTGRVILDFLRGRMPAYVDTGLNWVHVRDVAVGHILAAEKGRIGERYILGHAEGNWTLRETLEVLGSLTGQPVPRIRVPHAVVLGAAYLGEAIARLTGRPPRAPLAGVRMARHKMWVNPAKAIRELGLPQTPPRRALADAVEWFSANGYVK